ncbi:MAG TPA: hypothetical protein VJS37_17020 [Terriglobales bacterium]|nr:hypothetical protein [Terriglobales bacterium]
MMEEHPASNISRLSRLRSISRPCIAAAAISGGALVVLGAWLSWFSLFAGLQPYRGVDVLNGRLLAGCGALSVLAGVAFLWRSSSRLRWGIGLLGFTLLAFASWTLVQLVIMYRQLYTDPMLVPRLGPGLIVIVAGALLVFGTLFMGEGSRNT